MKKLVAISNIDLFYQSKDNETKAIDNLSLDIFENEFISIVGPSGCGKTTLLSLIAGLIKPSTGSIVIKGKTPTPKNNLCGYMFQRDNLLPWRNTKNNILFGLEIKRINTKEKKEYALNLAKKYGLTEFLKKHPGELSGGMRQRVALIRTLALKPDLLLLDEPFSALDYQTKLELCDNVYEIIKKEGKTAILVTHDIQEAISMSDRIIVLTSRPAHIRAIHVTNFNSHLTPFERRKTEKAKQLFDIIWKEIKNEKNN